MAGITKIGRTRATITLDDDAFDILKRCARHERAYGVFLSQLLRDYDKRDYDEKQEDHGAETVARLESIVQRLEALQERAATRRGLAETAAE